MMRISSSVSMSGKVLETGDGSGGVIAAYSCGRQLSDGGRVLPKRADPDYWIRGIVVDVYIRRQVHIDTELPEFTSDKLGDSGHHFCVTYGSKCHVSWKRRERAAEALHHPILLVGGDQQRIGMTSVFGDSL